MRWEPKWGGVRVLNPSDLSCLAAREGWTSNFTFGQRDEFGVREEGECVTTELGNVALGNNRNLGVRVSVRNVP